MSAAAETKEPYSVRIEQPIPQPTSQSVRQPAPQQQPSLEHLFVTLRANLLDAAYEEYPGLLVFDADSILDSLAGKLPEFTGQPHDFEAWATDYVKARSRHLRDYVSITSPGTPGRKTMSAAVSRSLPDDTFDCALDVEMIVDEICYKLVYPRVKSLMEPGKNGATVTTRLYALAKKHAWNYYGKPLRRRRQAVEKAISSGRKFGCEFLSDAELAEMKALEMQDAA
jgi:hypothetical protein